MLVGVDLVGGRLCMSVTVPEGNQEGKPTYVYTHTSRYQILLNKLQGRTGMFISYASHLMNILQIVNQISFVLPLRYYLLQCVK